MCTEVSIKDVMSCNIEKLDGILIRMNIDRLDKKTMTLKVEDLVAKSLVYGNQRFVCTLDIYVRCNNIYIDQERLMKTMQKYHDEKKHMMYGTRAIDLYFPWRNNNMLFSQ